MNTIDDELQQHIHETAAMVRTHSGGTGYLLFWLAIDRARDEEAKRAICANARLKIRVEKGGHNDAD